MLSRELERFLRAIWPAAAALLLGLAIGGVWTLLQPDRYLAKTHLILRGPPAARLAPAVETLANGGLVQENVRQTLRLSAAPALTASVKNGILEIRAKAGSKERARQIDTEAAQVVTQVISTRFGSQGLQASLLDPGHVTAQTSPTPARNLLLCGLLGLLAGGALAYPRWRPRGAALGDGTVDPEFERRLKKRIDEVTKRERAMARRAGELAKREAEFEHRRGELAKRDAELQQRGGELGQLETTLKGQEAALDASNKQLVARADEIAASEREVEARAQEPPPPPPEPAPVPLAPTAPAAHMGSWNINELQRAVDAQTDATAEEAEEWTTYLFFLREHTASDGSLPRQFDGLVEDVFGQLVNSGSR